MHVDATIAGRREHETDRQGVDHGHEAERSQRFHQRSKGVERDDDVEVAMRPALRPEQRIDPPSPVDDRVDAAVSQRLEHREHRFGRHHRPNNDKDGDVQIAFLLFPRVTALDAIGPYEVLQRLPGAEVIFVGAERGEVRTDNGKLGLTIDATLDEVPHPEVLVVPGGMGTRPLVKDETVLGWIRQVHETSQFTTSVCTGSLLLAAAGLLDGLEATTHWGSKKALEDLGARYTEQRVVQNGKIITAAGVSSGIDMALVLAAQLTDPVTAQVMQLFIEYDPQPPYDSGAASKASEAVWDRVAELRVMG